MKKNTTPAVDAIGEMNFKGNYIPPHWYKQMQLPSGKLDAIGATLLAHFAYGTVTSNTNELHISTDYFQVQFDKLSSLFGLTERQIIDAISRLCTNHYLIQYQLSMDEINKFFSKKTPRKFPTLNYNVQIYTCAWCKSDTFILHEHHHPTPKSEGGKEIVQLCPNCHFEYHYLERLRFYTVNLDHEMFIEVANESSADK